MTRNFLRAEYARALVKQILSDMHYHRLRSFLALLGITWGVISVVLLISLGAGFSKATQDNLIPLVDGTFFIGTQKASINYHGYPKGRNIKIKAREVMRLKEIFPSISLISPMMMASQSLAYKDKKSKRKIMGVGVDFLKLRKLGLTPSSRFVDPLDVKRSAKVIVLGAQTKQMLFGQEEAIGKKILLNNVAFTVIGVIQPPYKSTYRYHNREAIIPYSTYINMMGDQDVNYFMVFPDPARDPVTVKKDMVTYLGNTLHFSPQDEEALRVFDTTKIFQFFKWFFIAIQLFLGLCGMLTLGVGCLSVTNVMFLTVSERAHEIGIRMTLGAKPWHIRLQVILESLVIMLLGSGIGFVVSLLTIEILQQALLPEWLGRPEFSLTAGLITIFILLFLGVLSGFFPAERAAKLDPVDAISQG